MFLVEIWDLTLLRGYKLPSGQIKESVVTDENRLS